MEEPKKIFFITSNQTKLNNLIEYQVKNNRGLINLKVGASNSELKEEQKYKNNSFTVCVNSMQIETKDLKKDDQDPKSKKYNTTITQRYNKTNFPGYIWFRASKNNFIYDFRFNEYKGWGRTYDPPPQINFSQLEQLRLYIKYLKSIRKQQKDQIYQDLVADSQALSFGKKIYIDFFLEILKNCYASKTVKLFLKSFKIDNILKSDNFNLKDYSVVLNLIERKPDLIVKHCNEKEDKNIYYIIFYTILFYVRYNYDRDKALEMINNRNLWNYFIKILPDKSNYFAKINISDELIDQMFEQDLKTEIITGILSYCGSVEKILTKINDKKDIISNCCMKDKKLIVMSGLENPQKTDNLERIIEEIEKIIKYETENKKVFISFDELFWNNYIHFNDDVKKLYMINNAIILCSKVDKSLKSNKMNLVGKIHNSGIEAIKNGTLKNEELLYFINIDIYFSDKKYASAFYRTYDIVKGLDFEEMNDNFINQWNATNIYKIYSFGDYELKRRIVDKVQDMKYFGKLLRLFNYKDKNIVDYKLIQKLRETFKNLITSYKIENCPNLVEDIAYFIYIIDYQNQYDLPGFMTGTIEKYILSQETIKNIYTYLAANYKDISPKVVDSITNFFTKNKQLLNAENILFLLQKIKSQKIIGSLFNKIDSFVIKEEELFSAEKEIESFKLLEGIQKGGLFDKIQFEDFNKTKYLMNALQTKENVFNKIKTGDINFNLIKQIYPNEAKRNIFKEKLTILYFNNQNDVEESMKILKTKFLEVTTKVLPFLEKLKRVLKEFFENEHKNNLAKIEKLSNVIKSGNLNEIEKTNIKNEIEQCHNIFQKEEYEKNTKLIDSQFFLQLYRTSKANNVNLKNERDLFQQTEDEFNKLKLLFESENWSREIPESTIKICLLSLKQEKSKKLKDELNSLKKYFQIKDIDKLKLERLEKNITTFNQKEEIFQTANSCMYFITELEAVKTDFYDKLDKIRKDLQKNNISLDKIEEFGKNLEEYGLKVLEPEEKDRDYLNILHYTYNKKGSVKFIAKLDDNDIRTLQELVNMSDDTFITNNEIQDMIKCSKFIHNLGDIKGKKNDKDLIRDFINEVPKIKNIAVHFLNYTNNSSEIQELFSKKLDKSQATQQQIKEIMKSSTFTLAIDNNKDPYLKFEGEFINEEKAKKSANYDYIIELRERAMLTRKLGDDKSQEEKKIFNLYRTFSERVSEIEKINQLLEKLGQKGYSEDIKIVIDINENNPSFFIDNQRMDNYKNCSAHLDNLINKITDIQTRYYKNEELIRYAYGRQFNLLNSCLRKEKNNALAPFLKFLTNAQVDSHEKLKKLEYNYDYELNEEKYVCLFENIKKFLENFLKNNNLKLEEIYKQNIIKEKYRSKFVGLFTYLLEDDKIGEVQKGIEEHILNWFNFLTGHPPMAQTVLLCNEETTSEEITAFMYRAFLCQYPVFFMIGKIENLTSEKRQTLTKLINSLFSLRAKDMKSCVAFAYSEKNDSLVKYLEKLRGHEPLVHDDKKKEGQILYDENVEIISSDKAGVGKSTQIKLKVKAEGKTYIHFPFGGEFSRKDVINRLKKIQEKIINEEKTVIHLDLYDSKQVELMKDFLYSFLITKLYGQNENLFYLSKKVKIIIEIPCGFIDFFNKFPLLSMFKNRTEMKIENLPLLIVSKELNSNVQIVCNYLKLLKSGQLSDKDLIIDGISLSPDDIKSFISENVKVPDTAINAQSLDAKECDTLIKDLIKKELKIDHPTYYQINSFINVFSGQLKKFSMNVSLTAAKLMEGGFFLKNPNYKKLREIMVNSFIQNTIHFTQGAFDKILQAQQETYKVNIEQGNYDENKQEEVAVKALSEPGDIISCNKIDPPLVFFHEGEGQDFTIITNDNKNKPDYNKLLELRAGLVKIQNYAYQNAGVADKIEKVPQSLKQFTQYKHQDFLQEIHNILDIKNPVFTKDKEDKDKNAKDGLKSIEEIVGEYVFTADNFIKMVLILLRIRENIPVIMMGETGCGKTSLIRKLSELINNGESNMEILNIHAGITDEEIVKFLFDEKEFEGKKVDSIITKAKKLEEKEERKFKLYKEKGQKYFKKKLWVFLDEINTCNCMGLICEMMTKHTCQGEELPENIFFIGACNPYRYGKKCEDNYALKVEGVKEKKLVYTVNPLPFSLLNFIFNFGNLTAEDEKSYIKNMVVSPIENFFWKEIEEKHKDDKEFQKGYERKDMNKYIIKEDYDLCENLKKTASEAIIVAQNYVREKNDVSSVSLREIRRFSIFYGFFVDYFRKNKTLFENKNQNEDLDKIDTYYKNMSKDDIYKNSIKLSIYLCYYMRLSNKEFRKDLALKMNSIFGDNFIEIPEHEQQYIAKNIEMKKGIAKNRALLENLFTIFACVNAKVPLFIVGKPGCSKSLSVQLVFNAMKGDSSDNPLFKTLPKLFINSFQGSKGSTSKGVLNIFKKARNLLKNANNLDKIISMIYFDEMGLAEHSPNNPLKVIHAELEYDLNEGAKKIAFVGISNWILDASKMNRGLFLSIPKPDKFDLETTALTIAESYNVKLAQDHNELFRALANTYFEYKEKLQAQYTIKEDFHGSRDFYHLIKTSMRQLLRKKEEDLDFNIDENVKQEIGINSIERNFAGLEFEDGKEGSITSLQIFKQLFKKRYVNCDERKEYNVLKTIFENIKDKDSRYLLLVSKSSISTYLLNSILSSPELKKDLNKEFSFYIGSGFTKDTHSEGYGLKILNKIQLQMEQNKILLLSDLEALYPSLYDLFNQNFTVVSHKNYARIAMGSTNNTFSLVDDGFKCIVLVDEKDLDKQDTPFLNRFEKHIISFEYLLKKEYIDEAEKIYNIIQSFSNQRLQDNNGIDIKFNLSYLLINCDKEEIQGIIYNKFSELEKENKEKAKGKPNLLVQDFQDLVLEKIALTLPQDIIFLLKYSGFEQIYPNMADKIIQFYQKGEHANFLKFLKTMKNTKNVIYTFTSIDEPLLANYSGEIETELLGKINKDENITEFQINSLNEEKDLESNLDQVYSKDKKWKIVIIKFNPYETYIMNYVKFFIENYITEKNYLDENNKKVFIFTVHMNRIFESDEKDPKKKGYVKKNLLHETISHLSDFYQIFIDHLNGEDLSIIDIMKLKSNELFTKCLKLDTEFIKNIYNTFSYFNYNINNAIKGVDNNNYPNKVMNFLENNKEFTQALINCILKKPAEKIDIGEVLKHHEFFTKEDICIVTVVKRYLSQLFTDNLTKLIFKCEKDNFLSPFIYNEINPIQNDQREQVQVVINNEAQENNEEVEKEMNLNQNQNNNQNNIAENNAENNNQNNAENIRDKKYYLNNNLVKVLIDTYLETVNFSLNAVKKKIKNNKVSLSFGLRLPGIYIPLKEIIKYIKTEVKNKFFNAERDIIDLRAEEGVDFGKELDAYKGKIKTCLKNTEIEITKNKIFSKLNELENQYQKDSQQFYDLLMNDYYYLFIIDNLPDINDLSKNMQNYKNIIKLMLHQRFNTGDEGEEIDPIRATAKKMVWIETYSQYISILLNIFSKLSQYEEKLYNKIDKLIKDREILLEQDEKRNPHHTLEYKSPFYYITEALLRISIDVDLFSKLKGQEFYDFINLLKTIMKDCLIINDDLSIFSKEIFTIQQFLEIEEGLNNVNKSNEENIISVLKILTDLSKVNNQMIEISQKGQDLSNLIKQLYEFLNKNLGDTENFRELMMGIFVGELKKVKNDDYRLTLIDIILKNNSLIVYSYPFMVIIMSGFISSDPALITENLKNLQNANAPWIELINNANNDILNEILLSIFENKINIYFESIPNLSNEDLEDFFKKYYDYMNDNDGKINPTFIISDRSLEEFKQCANILETIYNNRKEGKKDIKNDLLCQLYAIAYIKIYLYKYADFSHRCNQQFIDFEEVLKAINGNAKTEVRQMLKIYVFKIFYYFLGNYQEFSNYNYKMHQINFFDELKDRFVEKKEAMLSYYMLPNGDDAKWKTFNEYYEKFDSYVFNEFNKPINEFVNYIKNNGIDSFYMISTDLIVSNLALQNYVKNKNDYNKYSSYVKNVFGDPQIKLADIRKKLFFLLSNDEIFTNTMKKKLVDEQNLKDINVNQYEILLYGLRFCLQTTNQEKPEEFLYSQLISQDCQNKFKQICIPGNNISDNIYIKNYLLVEKHLIIDNRPANIGAYVCGCGLYYDIGPCGFPNAPGVCVNCGKKIGYAPRPPECKRGHGMSREPGHYRIFKDLAQKQEQLNKYGDSDINIPNKLITEYKKEKIDPLIESEKYGVSKIGKMIFEDTNQKVRNQSQIGYRLLNFILYSHLFYANCLGFISNDEMKNYVCDGMNCIQMIEKDWNFLKDALQSKGIQIIQIFINLIFDKLVEKLKNCKLIKTIEDRDKFEAEIEQVLEGAYKEYENYSKIYKENNEKMLELDKNSMKSLVLETNDVNSYDANEYPYYKYFLMTTYPTREAFIHELKKVEQYERKYALIANYIKEENPEKFLIKYLPEFNEFCNFMIDYYSYKISREDAAKRDLKDEDLFKNDPKFKDKLKKFVNIWDKIKQYAIKFACRDEMPVINLNENQKVACFLNDDGDMGKGMYIASAYQNFIEWQNNFLDSLIEPSKQSGILHHFVKNMEHTIDVQKAKKNEALNFDIINKDFNTCIYDNCRRNIFRKDNSINYMNYKQFIYDFAEIEKYLGEQLLPGKVKFNSHEHLKFVTFCFEGFRKNKSSVLTDFVDKYKQVPLEPRKKQAIYDIIKNQFNEQAEELTKILFSIQLLLYYLTQERQNERDEIKTIIGELPEYVSLTPECKEFLQNKELNIRIEEIIGVFSFFELLCYKPIINNLQEHYKKDIKEDKRNEILKLFEDKKFKLITKVNLASACRKFISRYLTSSRKDDDFNDENDLSDQLTRYEFWSKEIFEKEDDLTKELNYLKNLQITVGQCFELYNLMGCDEKTELKDIKMKEDEVKGGADDDNEDDDDHRLVKRDGRHARGGRKRPNYT